MSSKLVKAEKLFWDFHKYDPKAVVQFPASFRIPDHATYVGPASYILYRSAKYDPITYEKPKNPINYIHEHKAGVKTYLVDDGDGPERLVPKYICSPHSLVLLGKCQGFGYVDHDGDDVEATCSKPELFAVSPSGKALYVIQGRRKVLALIWGGKLRVEPRGIVG